MHRVLMAAVAAMALSVAGASQAQMDDDPFTFSVTNNTTAVMTSMTLAPEGSAASVRGTQYLRRQLAQGQTVQINFQRSEERCRFRVVMDFSDGDQFRNTVDFCTIHGIRARNDGMRTY